jgi:hypothetical protein
MKSWPLSPYLDRLLGSLSAYPLGSEGPSSGLKQMGRESDHFSNFGVKMRVAT